MREKLVEYVTLLFAGTADSQDMRQEILQNTLDRYDDLIAQGKSPEAAYRLAIATIGDVQEILEEDPDKTNMPTKSKKHFSWAIPLSILLLLVYLGTFMLMFFLPKNAVSYEVVAGILRGKVVFMSALKDNSLIQSSR